MCTENQKIVLLVMGNFDVTGLLKSVLRADLANKIFLADLPKQQH